MVPRLPTCFRHPRVGRGGPGGDAEDREVYEDRLDEPGEVEDEEAEGAEVGPEPPEKKALTVFALSGIEVPLKRPAVQENPGRQRGSDGLRGPLTETTWLNSGRSCRALPPLGWRPAASRWGLYLFTAWSPRTPGPDHR